MAIYTIIRVYEVPAGNRYQATDRMLEALLLHTEKGYHVKDYIRDPGEKPGKGTPVKLAPPAGWLTLLIRQLTGKSVACLPTVHHIQRGGRDQARHVSDPGYVSGRGAPGTGRAEARSG